MEVFTYVKKRFHVHPCLFGRGIPRWFWLCKQGISRVSKVMTELVSLVVLPSPPRHLASLRTMKIRLLTLALVLTLTGSLSTALAQDLQANADSTTPEGTATQSATPSTPLTVSASRTVIDTPNVPASVGPFSQAIQVGNTIYCSGQIGIDPAANLLVYGGVGAETRQAMNNIRALLRESGYTLEDIVHVEVFLTDMDAYDEMNQVYGSYFFENPPARSVAQVAALPSSASIQISVTAVK